MLAEQNPRHGMREPITWDHKHMQRTTQCPDMKIMITDIRNSIEGKTDARPQSKRTGELELDAKTLSPECSTDRRGGHDVETVNESETWRRA